MATCLRLMLLLALASLCESNCNLCTCQRQGTSQIVNCGNRNPKLVAVPNGIPNDTEQLDLSDNELTDVDNTQFNSLIKLKRLNLNNNRLMTVYLSRLASLPNLERLDLQDNVITTFGGADQLTDSTSLKNIYLQNNPLNCDCALLRLREWAAARSVTLHAARCGLLKLDVQTLIDGGFGGGQCVDMGSQELLPPGPVTVKFIATRGATVSWESPSGGAPVLSYRVSCIPDFGVQIIPPEVLATQPLESQLTSLTPGQTYTVVIESKNAAISSGPSTAKFTTKPLSPVSVEIRDITPQMATVVWEPPGEGSQYSGFEILFIPPDVDVKVLPLVLGPRHTMAFLTNLVAGNSYTFNLVTKSENTTSVALTKSFSAGLERCSVCSDVADDAECTVQSCYAGQTRCKTYVRQLNRQWKISKTCATTDGCKLMDSEQGISFMTCCYGPKENAETCNAITDFDAYVSEVDMVAELVIRGDVDANDPTLDEKFQEVLKSVDAIVIVRRKRYDAASKTLYIAMTGSFPKGHVDIFVNMIRDAVTSHSENGGNLAPYVTSVTVREEGKACLLEDTLIDGRNLTWNSVSAGQTIRIPCPGDPLNNATRLCATTDTGTVVWNTPDTSMCTREPVQICNSEVTMTSNQKYNWPVANIGEMKTLPCSDEDSTRIVIRICEYTLNGPKWGEPDSSRCVPTTGTTGSPAGSTESTGSTESAGITESAGSADLTCSREETTDRNGKRLVWAETRVGVKAVLTCPDNPQNTVSRLCKQAGAVAVWDRMDDSLCNPGVSLQCPADVLTVDGNSYYWPQTLTGQTKKQPCSSANQENFALRTCLAKPNGAVWSPVDVSSCRPKYVLFCPAENVTTDRGQFLWPETEAGQTTRVQCPLTAEPRTAQRRCLTSEVAPIWEEPNINPCPRINDRTTDTLRALNSKPVTVENVIFVTSAMAKISSNTSGMTSEDVSLIGQLFGNVVQSESAFDPTVQSRSSLELVTAVSHMLNVDINQLGPAEKKNNTVKNLLHFLEEFAQGLTVTPGRPVTLVQPDLAISSVKVAKGQTISLAVRTKGESLEKNDVMVGVVADKSTSGISLPVDMFSANEGKASFIIYKKNSFFQAMTSDEDENVQETLPSGVILSASVGEKRENMKNPISITIQHNAKASNETPQCVYWDFALANGRGNWSSRGCRVARSTNESTVCECDHMTNFALLMDVYNNEDIRSARHNKILSAVSLVGCALSLLGLILTVITYLLFRRKLLKNMPSKILLNLCFALIGVNAVFLGGTHYAVDDAICKIVAALLHYFLLASFCWMLVEAFYMYLSLVRVFQTYFSKLILKFCLFAWGVPVVIVVINVSVNRENYGLQHEKLCWMPQLVFYIAFMAPLILVLVSNLISFIMVLHQLRAVSSRKKLTRAETQSTASQLRAALSILVLLGLTWLFGFLAISGATIVFAYLFAIFNTLQGLFIFIFYCVWKRDVQIAWMRSLACCPDVDESTSKSQFRSGSNSDEWFRVRGNRPSMSTSLSGMSRPMSDVSGQPPGISDDGMVHFVSFTRSQSVESPSDNLGGFDSKSKILRSGPKSQQRRMLSTMWNLMGDSSSAYRKKGSFGTTFTSFQKETTPQRKFSESTQITDQQPTTTAHVNQLYDVKTNGDGIAVDVNDVHLRISDNDVKNMTSDNGNYTPKPLKVEQNNSTVV